MAQAMLRLSEFCTDYPQRVIAIGEIGLDFYSGRHHANQQIAWLEAQFELAIDLELPVILHVRKAHEDVIRLLKRYPGLKGVCHGFTGAPELAERYITLGFKLGIGGQVTFENAHRLHRTVRGLPLTAFLLETDAPWMPPSGYNGAMNTPLTLLIVAQVVARLKGLTLDEVALQTTLNAHEVFKR
jgi:TatD DNase family protein